jgi:cytochrome b6-f complex iron-sulfur subunit
LNIETDMENEHGENDGVTRREFLLLTATAALAAGCQGVNSTGTATRNEVVDAGLASNYAAEGIYSNFRNQGFFIIRKDGRLSAISAICTHRRCKLDAEPDRSFYCPCHGSTFDPNGKVTEGPAKRDLQVLSTSTDAQGHLIVKVVDGVRS